MDSPTSTMQAKAIARDRVSGVRMTVPSDLSLSPDHARGLTGGRAPNAQREEGSRILLPTHPNMIDPDNMFQIHSSWGGIELTVAEETREIDLSSEELREVIGHAAESGEL